MNFLAHASLSFNNTSVRTGNLISDFVKGKAQYNYPEAIQQGIRLHRAIDAFTDAHAATKEAARFFKNPYRLYSGAFVDIVYDHFLAADENEFPADSLLPFSEAVYASLEADAAWLPNNFERVFLHMKSGNWLYNYRTLAGTHRALAGMAQRAVYLTEGETAFALLQQYYIPLQQCYAAFWPDVKTFAKQQIERVAR